MISLLTRFFAEFFDPVVPPPFLPVTLLQFLLSQNWSQQTRGTWHAVALCHVQGAGPICSLIMKCTWCANLLAEKGDLWPCATARRLLFSGALCSKSLESKTCNSVVFCAIAAPLLHGAKWKYFSAVTRQLKRHLDFLRALGWSP